MSARSGHPAVLLDRDGVINRKAPEPDYITQLEAFELLPGVPEAIARLGVAGYRVVVVTNQRGVARGLVEPGELRRIHDHLVTEVARGGGRIDGVYTCVHDIADGCACRKPAPGLLLQAARELQLDLGRSWMIGDRAHDIVAGRRAGCGATIWIKTSDWIKTIKAPDDWSGRGPDHTVADLPEAAELIWQRGRPKRYASPS